MVVRVGDKGEEESVVGWRRTRVGLGKWERGEEEEEERSRGIYSPIAAIMQSP